MDIGARYRAALFSNHPSAVGGLVQAILIGSAVTGTSPATSRKRPQEMDRRLKSVAHDA
jgi:hypothetical protein